MCIPDYPVDKTTYYNITHDGNIKVGRKALEAFRRISKDWTNEERRKIAYQDYS
jgi:hypothetical protein